MNIGPLEIIFFLMFFGGIFVTVNSLQRRLNSRPCLRCGERVPNGQLHCDSCGFDFSTVGRGES